MWDGVYDHGDNTVFIPTPKGRRPVIDEERTALVRQFLTETPTATLESVREHLNNEGIEVSTTSVWRMARDGGLSNQLISYKPGVVFTPQITQQRFQYAEQVNEIPDVEIWYLDESGFNLHLATSRCWAKRGHTPVHGVPANRGKTCRY